MDSLSKYIIDVSSLSYSVNKKKILDDITFQINHGDILSIIGPNGAGKSTLLRLISGELKPTSGEIKINNIDIKNFKISDFALNRSVLYQTSNIAFAFSVRDIINMGSYPYDLKGKFPKVNSTYNELLNTFELTDYEHRIYTSLSGGEKQRVQLARVIYQIIFSGNLRNKILILDEPTSFLDIKYQLLLFNYLKTLNDKGLSIIMVIHDLNLAVSHSHKSIILNKSKMVDFGAVKNVITPKNLSQVFEANFNLFYDDKKNIKFISYLS